MILALSLNMFDKIFGDVKYSVHKGGYSATSITTVSTEYWIEINNLNPDSLYSTTTKNEWIKYLENESTSWNANLILYAIHKENAYWFYAFDNEQKWFADRRTADIKMWKAKLK